MVTALSLYGYISPAFDAWEQRPVPKTYLTEPVVIRVGPPWFDSQLLRQIPEHFPTEDHRLQLPPAHEGEGRPLAPGAPAPRSSVSSTTSADCATLTWSPPTADATTIGQPWGVVTCI